MKTKIGAVVEVLSLLFVIWLAGLVFCLVHYALGGGGTDMLSNHYRSVILLVSSLI